MWFKYQSEKTKKNFLILSLISRGDIRARELSHDVAHLYSEFRGWLEFFVKKQLPLRTKSTLNKSQVFIKEQSDKYLELIRDSKLLRKSDGISEFFKNVSSVEKGNGEIDGYSEAFQEEDSEVK